MTIADSLAKTSLILGSCLTIVVTSFVLTSYATMRRIRRHPKVLMFMRSSCDMLGALTILVGLLLQWQFPDAYQDACRTVAFCTHFFLISAEISVLLSAIDLWMSFKNPFTGYKANLRLTMSVGVVAAAAMSVALVTVTHHGQSIYGSDSLFGVCWIANSDFDDGSNPYLWLLFVIPILMIYVVSVGVLFRARSRLHRGLKLSLPARWRTLTSSFRLVLYYVAYWTLALSCFIWVVAEPVQDAPIVIEVALIFLFAGRGIVSFAIWIGMHNWAMIIRVRRSTNWQLLTGTIDYRPHLNIALRRTVVFYATVGITAAVTHFNVNRTACRLHIDKSGPRQVAYQVLWLDRSKEVSGFQGGDQDADAESSKRPRRPSDLFTPLLSGVDQPRPGLSGQVNDVPRIEASSSVRHRASTRRRRQGLLDLACHFDSVRKPHRAAFQFRAYAPDLFHQVRSICGLTDEEFLAGMHADKREKVSEGASGAYLYFTEDERFIIKTMDTTERHTLLEILPDYVQYLQRRPNSLITKFYGCYAVRFHGRLLNFVVMENVFHTAAGRRPGQAAVPRLQIHERYDLKGSWVNRHRQPLEKGKSVTCRYCHQTFRVGDSRYTIRCPQRFNRPHEANTILKDNDLTYKLRIPTQLAEQLGQQIEDDCVFLRRCGIMDYSLLLGIHRGRYLLVDSRAQHEADSARPQQLFAHGDRSVTATQVEGPAVYFLGIVDVLQKFTLMKRVERAFKVYVRCQNAEGISAAPPQLYCDRFSERVSHQILEYKGRRRQRHRRQSKVQVL